MSDSEPRDTWASSTWRSTWKGSYCLLAGVCFVLGTIGIVLPLLPTTPFYLLANYLLVRSSPRLHGLLRSKLLRNSSSEDSRRPPFARPFFARSKARPRAAHTNSCEAAPTPDSPKTL